MSPVTYWRLQRGLTQEELAARAGLSGRSAICKIEAREAAAPGMMAKLSEILGVPIPELFPKRFETTRKAPPKCRRRTRRAR